jgi:serine/threonine protein kinase
MIGKNISKYKIVSLLGEGGMGKVYLAEDTELQRKVALKFLQQQYTKDEKINSRFKQEARVMASINYPNIVTIFEVGDFKDSSYIAMEYVEGASLDALIKEEKISLEQVFDFAIQICSGLNEAHKASVIHRDIKPSNIRVEKKGLVKILDFGLAKLKEESRKTSKSTTIGTLYYLSPEQVRGLDVDHRADIFSFGIVLYEMITAKLPFTGVYEAEVIYSIINEVQEPLARYKAGVSENLQKIVDKALEKNVEMRYQHIDDLMADLKNERELIREKHKEASTQIMKKKDVEEAVRKLAAIMFADIVGFSQMMGKNEDQTLKLLEEYEKIVAPVIQKQGGTILKKLGDGLFCEFSSAVAAVECAIQIHESLDNFNQASPQDFNLAVRIGIHMGDVVKKGDDLFGDGVNVAARLETMALPGGICVSDTIYSAISSHPEFEVLSLGHKKLKNIDHTYHLYRIKTGYETGSNGLKQGGLVSKISDFFNRKQFSVFINLLKMDRKKRIYFYLSAVLFIVIAYSVSKFLLDSSTSATSDVPTHVDSRAVQSKNGFDALITQGLKILKSQKSQKFIQEVMHLANTEALSAYLEGENRAGTLVFGERNDFFTPENKFVVVYDEKKIHAVLLFYKEKFIDQADLKKYDDLSLAFRGKKIVWIEIF